jgi:hypothetical protein
VYLRVAPSSVTAGQDRPRGGDPPPVEAAGASGGGWERTLRPSPIAMTAVEADGFLRGHDVAAVAWLDADGWPQVALARYRGGFADLSADVALSEDGQVCVTVDEFPTYNTIRGVMLHGRGRMMGSVLTVVPERIVSFDFRKITASGSDR